MADRSVREIPANDLAEINRMYAQPFHDLYKDKAQLLGRGSFGSCSLWKRRVPVAGSARPIFVKPSGAFVATAIDSNAAVALKDVEGHDGEERENVRARISLTGVCPLRADPLTRPPLAAPLLSRWRRTF
jgi:hypothetical protein